MLSRSASEVQPGLSSCVLPVLGLPSVLGESWEGTISHIMSCFSWGRSMGRRHHVHWSGTDWTLYTRALQPLPAPLTCRHSLFQTDRKKGKDRHKTTVFWFPRKTVVLTEVSFAKCPNRFYFHFWLCEMKAGFSPKIAKWICCSPSFLSCSEETLAHSAWVPLAVTMQKEQCVPPISVIRCPQARLSIPMTTQGSMHLLAFLFLLILFNSCFSLFIYLFLRTHLLSLDHWSWAAPR